MIHYSKKQIPITFANNSNKHEQTSVLFDKKRIIILILLKYI